MKTEQHRPADFHNSAEKSTIGPSRGDPPPADLELHEGQRGGSRVRRRNDSGRLGLLILYRFLLVCRYDL
jgi:hypothetical protein